MLKVENSINFSALIDDKMKGLKPLLVRIVFLGCILFCFVANAQIGHKLSGRIYDCKFKTPIKNTIIKLVCIDQRTFETKSDSSGFYFFHDSVLKPSLEYVLTTIAPDETVKVPYGMCQYSYFRNGYLNSADKVKFKTEENISNANIIHDFCLIPIQRSLIIPTVFFKKNSLEFGRSQVDEYDYYVYSGDTAVDCLVDLMKNFPQYVFELAGHADKKEKNPKKLSELRVKKVYDLMVLKGIEKDRLSCKSYGKKQPLEKRDLAYKVIGKLKGPINQRVVVSVLRKDYNLPQKKEIPLINTDEED
ncbi:MAG: OmpA family protein [Bacteroidetes bacterium]|nr:OmpA family protein [Bacteroidota bacterium]